MLLDALSDHSFAFAGGVGRSATNQVLVFVASVASEIERIDHEGGIRHPFGRLLRGEKRPIRAFGCKPEHASVHHHSQDARHA